MSIQSDFTITEYSLPYLAVFGEHFPTIDEGWQYVHVVLLLRENSAQSLLDTVGVLLFTFTMDPGNLVVCHAIFLEHSDQVQIHVAEVPTLYVSGSFTLFIHLMDTLFEGTVFPLVEVCSLLKCKHLD